jgi:hypothetical protein
MLVKGIECELIRGLCPHFIRGGVVSLQYSDDTLLFPKKDARCGFSFEMDTELFWANLWIEN